jgi:Fe-S-cluster containining protein
MSASGFPCSSCGLCCTGITEYATEFLSGKGFLGEDNHCIHLIESVRDDEKPIYLCAIYEDRPFECRTKNTASVLGLEMDQEEIFRLTAIGCNTLQEQKGFDESYRVQLSTHGTK